MSIPSFMLPTNFRNDKNIKRMIKEFDVQGYGIAVYLLETLAETDNHMYPYSDIDLLADEMRISTAKIETVIKRYNMFEIIKTTDGDMFISSKLNRWLEPYYAGKEQRQIAGKISAQKRKQKQLKQLLELSQIDSIQRPLNDRSTINELINKLINQLNIDENNEEEKEKWREFEKQQIKKMMETDKLEELALAYRDNQVPI